MLGQTVDAESFRVALNNLRARLRRCDTETVSLEEIRTLSKSVANLWFHDVGPLAKLATENEAALKSLDDLMSRLIDHTLRATRRSLYLSTVNEALRTYERGIYVDLHKKVSAVLAGGYSIVNDQISESLARLSESLVAGYRQVHKDLADESRISWRGTANELREVLRELLEMLAPDETVMKMPWFKQEPNTQGPTQAQRARYALEQRATQNHRASAAQETANLVEESVSRLVRKTYQRANNAAHTSQDKDEVKRILGYFDLLAKDLLGLS
jgi:Predicted pPIWI-associating nuclease